MKKPGIPVMKIFRSKFFRAEAAQRLAQQPDHLALCLGALTEGGVVAEQPENGREELAWAGAYLLCAIGSRQVRPESIVRVASRLSAMRFQLSTGRTSAGPVDPTWASPGRSFAADIVGAIDDVWKASRGATTYDLRPTSVSMTWRDEHGSILFGCIEQWPSRRKRIYASEDLSIPDDLGPFDFVDLPSVGGIAFPPIAVLGLAELLDECAEEYSSA